MVGAEKCHDALLTQPRNVLQNLSGRSSVNERTALEVDREGGPGHVGTADQSCVVVDDEDLRVK